MDWEYHHEKKTLAVPQLHRGDPLSVSSSGTTIWNSMMASQRHFTAACLTVALIVAIVIYMTTTLADGMAAMLLNNNRLSTNSITSGFEDTERPSMPMQTNLTHVSIIQVPKITSDPLQRLVFLKTHKTGSSTVTSVLQRYGYLKGLSFLMPKCGHIFDTYQHFNLKKVQAQSSKSAKTKKTVFNFLTNHARYSRPDMDEVFRGAKYVTILRNPVTQFESMFYYFEMFRYLPMGKTSLAAFFTDPEKNFQLMRSKNKQFTEKRMHNQQLFDLGVDLRDMKDSATIDDKINRLHSEFDLIMITEYFEESMLLLSKLMHLKLEDVRNIPRGSRQSGFREPLTDDIRAQIRTWNSADVKLYQHFNRTFWEKVKAYGPNFEEDLRKFRRLQIDLSNTCRDAGHDDMTDRRVTKARLKDEAPKWCSHFFTNDVQFTALIRKRMKKKGLPLYDTCAQGKSKTRAEV